MKSIFLIPSTLSLSSSSLSWQPARNYLSILFEQSHLNHTTAIGYSHITDEYFHEYGTKQSQ